MDTPLIILVYPKIDYEDNYAYHWVPFSLLTIAKALSTNKANEVAIFDGNQRDMNEWEMFLTDKIQRALCIGFSVMTHKTKKTAPKRSVENSVTLFIQVKPMRTCL